MLILRPNCNNINSARNKAAIIHDIIDENSLDCLVLTETRLQADLPSAIKDDIAPEGFSVRHVHRSPTARHPLGGGLALISRESLTVSHIHSTLNYHLRRSSCCWCESPPSGRGSPSLPSTDRPTAPFCSSSPSSDVLGQVIAANTDRLL